jgi:hypothetical protein
MKTQTWWESVQKQIDAGETDKRIYCLDCGDEIAAKGDWCMLEDKVWAGTGIAPDGGVLCLECIEGRLGRYLETSDFAIADESDRLGGFWPGHRMLPKRWAGYVALRARCK